MKTQNNILSDVAEVISTTPINDLNGEIYKKTRPTDSILNDCLITLIPGVNGKFIQTAALYVKIFYNDLHIKNSYMEDMKTGSAMESLLFDLSETFLKKFSGYSFQVQSRETYTEKVVELNQHYAILKINFKTLIK